MPTLRSSVSSTAMILGCLAWWGLVSGAWGQPPNSGPASLDAVRQQVKEAGELFKGEKFLESAEKISSCAEALVPLILKAEKKDLAEWERVHRQLQRAAEALSIQGAEISAIPEWKEIQDQLRQQATSKPQSKPPVPGKAASGSPEAEPVLFSTTIAPLLVQHCGRCHIDKASGEFTMATYEALMKGSKAGVVLFPGDPVSSPLVAAVESGQMPPNGNRVPPEGLEKLKAWVTQGAKFDGADSKANLKELANGSPTAPRSEPAMVEIKTATGKETVSFSNDIAPILVSNCNGCHYQGNNAPGGLRLNTFSELLKGGDSGPIVLPGNPDESLLVQKLLGMSGQRMPAGGRPPLSEPQIDAIKTWIREGATFDGDSRDSRLDGVIAKYWTAKANHQELMERRMERAREKWQVVAPKSIPDEAADQDIHVVGNIGPAASESLLSLANQVAKTLRKQYRLGAKAPIVKGGITIFALKSRYDYSELGKMLEKRELPASWSAHWRKETPDLYIAMVYDSSDAKINESTLVQQMTSAWIGSVDGTPRWFAEGVGRNALANTVGMNDVRVQPWSRRFPDILAELKNVQPVLEGKINDEDLAIVGFGTIRRWMGTPLRPKYELLLRQLAGAESFDETFSQILGPADLFLKQMLGKP